MPWVKAQKAKEFYSVSSPTLRAWSDNGKIRSQQQPSGRYQYWIEEGKKQANDDKAGRHTIIYARVSSKKQSEDLRRQEEYLRTRYPNAILKSDIGSGINYKRTNFKTILQSLFKGDIKEVVVAHKDRFTRFSFEFFEWLFTQFGSILTSLENEEHAEGETGNELTDDLMEVITVFTARYYGSRKYKEIKSSKKSEG
jgi:predicted site-specific integrase-resolvase